MRSGWIVGGLIVVAAALALWMSRREGDERPVAGLAPRTELASQLEAPAETVETPEIARETVAPVGIAEEVIEPELYFWNARARGRVLDYSSGAPVADVTVEMETHAADGLASTRTASTDAQGRFEFDGLQLLAPNPPRPALALAVRAPGYAPYFANVQDRAYERPRDAHETLELALGDVRLRRGTLLAGLVVRESDGMGVEGATIHFTDLRPDGDDAEGLARFAGRLLREVGVSGADGRFELSEPVPTASSEAYLLGASKQGVGWAKIAVVEGLEHVGDVELVLGPPRALAVQVVDARGEVVHGAELALKSMPHPSGPFASRAVQARPEDAHSWADLFQGRTDELGGWRAAPLPAASGFNKWRLEVSAMDGRNNSVPVAPAALDAPPVRIVLPDLADASARTIAGRVVDVLGRPFAGVRVQLRERTVLADEEGRFRMERPAKQQFELRFLVTGPGISGGSIAVLWVASLKGELELVFQRAAPIAGLVTDHVGRALAGVELALDLMDGEPWRTRTWTDAHGRFRIEDAPEGGSRLVGPDALPGNREPVNAIAVQGGDESVHFVCDMRPAGTGRLALRVVDAITRAPRAPLEVRLFGPATAERVALDGPELPLTKTLGLVTVAEMPAGAWRVSVCVDDGRWAMIQVDVLAGVLTEAELLVGLGGALAGRVRADASLEGAWVEVDSERGSALPRAAGLRDDGMAAIDLATGAFRLDGLDPGDYTLTLEGSELAARAVASVLAGEETQVELHAQAPARLRLVSDVPLESNKLSVHAWTGELMSAAFDGSFARAAPIDFEVEVEPGLVRREMETRANSDSLRVGAPPTKWTGEATLSPGQEWPVRLDPQR